MIIKNKGKQAIFGGLFTIAPEMQRSPNNNL